MYRLIHSANMPKWLKILTYILLTFTLVYWIFMIVYKTLECIRIVVHFVSEKRNWWTFIICILILVIGSLLIAQFTLNLNPFGKFVDWIKSCWTNYRLWLSGLIGGV